MKIGKIHINGAIGEFVDHDGNLIKGVTLVDIVAQVAMQLKAKRFNVYINSEGGLVEEGFKIHDYLKNLDVPVDTIGHGLVASMGTVIFMAGEKRTLLPNTEFMIHLPNGGVSGDSQDIKEYSDYMQKEEKRSIKFYSENTKLKESTLLPLLKSETWLDPQKAFELGFSTEAPLERKAIAHFKSKSNNKMKKVKNKKDKTGLSKKDRSIIMKGMKALESIFGGETAKMLVIQNAEGDDVTFPEVEAMEDVAKGDKATVDGADAEGDHVFPDGKTYTFKGGVLDSITDGEEEEEETVEEMKAKLELAEQENAALKATNKKAKKEFKAFKGQLDSKFDFAGVKGKKKGKKKKATGKTKKKNNTASTMAANAAKLAEKRRKRNA